MAEDFLPPENWTSQRWWIVYAGAIGALVAVALCVNHILFSLSGKEKVARNWAVLFGIALTAVSFGLVLQLYVLPDSWPLWQLWTIYLGSFAALILIVAFFEEFIEVLQKVHFWKLLLWAILFFGPAFIFIKADGFLMQRDGLAGMAARLLSFAVDEENGRGAVWWLLYSLLWTVAACILYMASLAVRWIVQSILIPLCFQFRLWLRDRMRHSRMLASIEKKREKGILEEYGGDPSRLPAIIAFIAMTLSGYTTMQGFRFEFVDANEGPLLQWGVPIGLAIISSVLTYYIWTRFFRMARLYGWTGILNPISLIALSISIVVIFSISTLLGVVGVSSDKAMKTHFLHTLSELELSASAISDQKLEQLALEPVMRAHSEDLARLSELERNEGLFTGFAGDGQIAGFLESASNRLNFAWQELGRLEDERTRTLEILSAEFEEFRTNMAGAESGERFRDLEPKYFLRLRAIRDDLARLKAVDPIGPMREATEALDSVIERSGSSNAAIAAAQRQRLQTLRQRFSEIKVSIESNFVSQSTEVIIPEPQQITRLKAVVVYFYDVISGWVVQGAVDFGSIVIILILLIMRRRVLPPQEQVGVEDTGVNA